MREKKNEEECKCINILLSGIWLVFLKLKFMEILDEIVIFKINLENFLLLFNNGEICEGRNFLYVIIFS